MRKTAVTVIGLIIIALLALAGVTQRLFFARAATTTTGGLVVEGLAVTQPAAPSGASVHNDDHVATIRWSRSPDRSVVGYRVSWSGGGAIFTPYADANLQPLNDGQTYTATVQAVDGSGNLSAPINFSGIQTDPTRVNTLRTSMNAQFDDFNTAGTIDPLHWFTTGEAQIAGQTQVFSKGGLFTGAFPMFDQLHMHMYTTGDGQPQSVTMRALHPFDFTNRTGTIAFDFDWGDTRTYQGGDSYSSRWFLVLSPTLVDAPLTDGGPTMYPGDGLRLTLQGRNVSLDVFQGGHQVASYPAQGFNKDINVRKPTLFKVSQTTADLVVDGVNVLHVSGLNLPWSVAYLYSQQWDYDLGQFHLPARVTHWDNFGFDAPAGYASDVTHVYTTGTGIEGDIAQASADSGPRTWNIAVPDALAGATGVRAFIDMKSDQSSVAGTVSLNGVARPFATLPVSGLPGLQTASRVVSFPVAALKQGVNALTLNLAGCGCSVGTTSVHLEVTFPEASTAPFSPYAGLTMANVPMTPSIGPETHLGAQSPREGATLSGVVPVEAIADAATTLLPLGKVDAVTAVAVMLDGKPVLTQKLNGPTVYTDQVLSLDTSTLANGQHTLSVAGIGASGAVFDSGANSQFTQKVHVTISNSGPAPSTPPPGNTPTPAPGNTATPTPAPVPQGINNVPCVVTIQGVQQKGTCSGTFTPSN